MPSISSFAKRLLGGAGLVITFIGLVSLPGDLGTWQDRLGELWAMVEDNPVSGGAVVVGIVLIIVASWDKLIGLFVHRQRWPSDAELDDELHKWFREANYATQDLPGIGASFNFSATGPGTNRPVTVLKPSNESALYLTGVVRDNDWVAVIEKMNESELADLKADLGLEVIRLPVPISILGEDLTGAGVFLQHAMVLTDSLTRSIFMERVVRVSAAILLVQIVLRKHINATERRLGLVPRTAPQSTPSTAASPTPPAS